MTILTASQGAEEMASESGNSNVTVIVRVRPPNQAEREPSGQNVVEIMNENVLIFDPKDEPSPFFGRRGKHRHRDIRKRRHKDLRFAFDRVFGHDSNNQQVFEQTTRTVLNGLLAGYNCSVFAYGATGAGKTHTMLGSEHQPGVIYHTMVHLYRIIADMAGDKTCDVAVSYLEVYNEQIRDLLLPRATLPVREDPNSGVLVPGLSLHKPSSADELLYMLQFGNKNRTQHPTDANAESSRSHAVFQVYVRQQDRTAGLSAQVKVGKMCLVDLAGSERATVTKNRGQRLREGANINRSLLALGNVINALADNRSKGHIPYRDSKLTRLLKDSLGGNCRTIMIAAVSPSRLSYEDTYNTLKYADRAKNIRLNMKKNVISVDFHISRYGKIVEDLHHEISELKLKLQTCEGPRVSQTFSLPPDFHSLREKLATVYAERRSIREQQLRQETEARDVQWRLHCRHKCLTRAATLQHAHPQTLERLRGAVSGLERRLGSQDVQRYSLAQRLTENDHTIAALQEQASRLHDDQASSVSIPAQMLDLSVRNLALDQGLADCRLYIHHLRRLARAQQREATAADTLISMLLGLVQRQNAELQSYGPLSSAVSEGYSRMCELVGQWGVSWADADEDQEVEPFHINAIIDIPLVTPAGQVLDQVPVSENANMSTASSSSMPARVAKATPNASCPGRILNGSVEWSTAASSMTVSQPPPSAQPSASCSASAAPAATCGTPATQLAQATTVVERGAGDLLRRSGVYPEPCAAILAARPSALGSSTMAGHTPGTKRLPSGFTLPTAGDEGVTSSLHLSSSSSLPASSSLSAPPSSLPGASSLPRSSCGVGTCGRGLDETFSLGDCDPNSTVCLPAPSLPTVPVIDPPSQAVPQSAPLSERSQLSTSLSSVGGSELHLKVMDRPSSCVPPSGGFGCGGDGSGATGWEYKVREGGSKPSEHCVGKAEKENQLPPARQGDAVKRSINFEAVSPLPSPGGSRSYADVVKTPTPPRHPLQSMDCNSPHVLDRISDRGLGQTPRSTTGGMYCVDPQTLSNIHRLKQLGMPSLVENLLSPHLRGLSKGGCSKPSYMQPTKATARRVRRHLGAQDDSCQPKRVRSSSLLHSRSKSTSALNKVGWKI